MSDSGLSRWDEELISVVASGRSVLLLGQGHSTGLEDAVRDIAAAAHTDQTGDLRSQIIDRIKPDELANVRRALSFHSADEQLIETVSQPWATVVTSAVDSMAAEALRRAAAAGRRLRVLFPSQLPGGQPVRSAADSLTVLRLFGSLDEEEARFLPPLDSRALRQRQRFEVAAVLHQLPFLLGPYGHLVIVGLDRHDWLDLEDVALACADLPQGAIHWFGEVPAELDGSFVELLVRHDGTFADLVRRAASTAAGKALDEARLALHRPARRALTVRTRNGSILSLQLAPEDWRSIGQVGVLLDDESVDSRLALGPDENRDGLRAFLRHPQYLPDWEAIGRGFLFERAQGAVFLEQIERSIADLGSVRDESKNSDGASGSRLPLLLTGPPACGKSRLLHWLAFELRRRRHAVLYLFTPAGRVHPESIERACRLIEGRGATHIVVVADGLDDVSYLQLNEMLASSGRNAVVLGARSASQRLSDADDPRQQSGFAQSRPLAVPAQLTPEELDRFGSYLAAHGFSDVPVTADQMRHRYFLLLLYRLLPDARGNIHLSLGNEYDSLLSVLDEVQGPDQSKLEDSSWARQLDEVRQVLFPELEQEDSTERSRLEHLPAAEHAVNLCLFCSQIGKPLPLDLLLRTEGREFLSSYREFAAALDRTALLHEVEVDSGGTIVLDADHPIVAQLTLATVLPRHADQLRLLTALIDAVSWDERAFPGDRPEQDYCIEVLQAVGPRGVGEREFQSPQSLEVIAELLARVRIDNAARLPRLLLLEANTLRFLADRSSADFETAMSRCDEALRVLDDAERILESRRPTAARNSELRNVLNTRAAVHGFIAGNLLREYRSPRADFADVRSQIFANLADVDRLASRSRGLGDPSFYPLDVTFWVYRDAFELLPDLTEEERVRLLGRMEAVLDSATEEPIETDQLPRLNRRKVNLAQLEGNVTLSRDLATRMREAGDFSGECLLIRREVFDPGTRQPRSRKAAEKGLERLESFGHGAYENLEALDLMNLLWRAAYLPRTHLGGADPLLAGCDEDQWVRWRRILEARMRIAAGTRSAFAGFCLSWTLFQLGESRLALQEIRAVEPLSGGSRRRVGSLVVLTDSSGAPLRYRAAVRRREGATIVTYVSSLASEVRLAPAFTSRFAVLPDVGDELELEVGLNYRGLLPWRVV